MTTIRLIDARRGLHQQCESLFRDKKVADQIYSYLCDGLEECEEVEPERKKGEWEMKPDHYGFFEEIPVCSECGCTTKMRDKTNFCPNCGADMRERREE